MKRQRRQVLRAVRYRGFRCRDAFHSTLLELESRNPVWGDILIKITTLDIRLWKGDDTIQTTGYMLRHDNLREEVHPAYLFVPDLFPTAEEMKRGGWDQWAKYQEEIYLHMGDLPSRYIAEGIVDVSVDRYRDENQRVEWYPELHTSHRLHAMVQYGCLSPVYMRVYPP